LSGILWREGLLWQPLWHGCLARKDHRVTQSPDPNPPQAKAPMTDADTAEGTAPIHLAQTLTNGGTTARIYLNDQVYSLRITRQGKLILTK
jgi:hemin uptake protein HemP